MKNESKYNTKEKILIYALAVTVGVVLSLLSIILFAIIMQVLDLGESTASLFAALSLAIGGFFSAFFSSKKLKKKGIVNGLVCAIVTFLLVFFISLIADKGGITLNTFFNFLSALLSGLIGGISGIGQKKYGKI